MLLKSINYVRVAATSLAGSARVTLVPASLRHFSASAARKAQARNERIHHYAEMCVTSGFVPPIRRWALVLSHPVVRLWLFVQVGRIRVVGLEHLKKKGSFIFTPNHPSLLDPLVMFHVLRRNRVHFMTGFEGMLGLGGWQAMAMAAVGCYPVDRSRGYTVVRNSIDLLLAGDDLVIYPEAGIRWYGECVPLKNGASYIARKAQLRAGRRRIGIIPVRTQFHKVDSRAVEVGFNKMGLKWRGGVTVTIGAPIFMDAMENGTTRDITAAIHDFICGQ